MKGLKAMARASSFEIRETLDAAIRSLSIDSGTLRERLHAAAAALLGRLSPADFSEEEERELFEDIQIALIRLNAKRGGDALTRTIAEMSDARAEQIASDILDLRDMRIGSAIREGPDGEADCAEERSTRLSTTRSVASRRPRR